MVSRYLHTCDAKMIESTFVNARFAFVVRLACTIFRNIHINICIVKVKETELEINSVYFRTRYPLVAYLFMYVERQHNEQYWQEYFYLRLCKKLQTHTHTHTIFRMRTVEEGVGAQRRILRENNNSLFILSFIPVELARP